MTTRVLRAVLEGIFWSVAGAVVLWLCVPVAPVAGGLFSNAFASRWNGGCNGWTKPLATLHVVGDLLTWTAYVTIAIVVMRLHPILRRVRSAKATVTLIVLVFTSCGATHLIDAYATFNPIYVAFGWFKMIAAVIGLTGACFIAHDLVVAFDKVEVDRRRLAELEEKFGGK